MTSKLEKDIESYLCDQCEEHNFQCLKLRIDGQNGFPDRTILTPFGVVAFVELKNGKQGRTSRRQDYWIEELRQREFIAEVIRTCEQVDSFISSLK